MKLFAQAASLDDILPWRDMYRLEMSCQIIHDSIHSRPGWTQEYLLCAGEVRVGYGSMAIAGPWKEKPTLYEFYLVPQHRSQVFDFLARLLKVSELLPVVKSIVEVLLRVKAPT